MIDIETSRDARAKKQFVNLPTELMLQELSEFIRKRKDLEKSPEVQRAVSRLEDVCCESPAIIDFIRRKSELANPFFTTDQIKLIMLATLMRSSSTYGTILNLVVMLNLSSDFTMAKLINENAMHEAGNHQFESHALLLLQGFEKLCAGIEAHLHGQGESTSIPSLNQARHALVRQIFALQTSDKSFPLTNIALIKQILFEEQVYLPDYTDDDIRAAIDYCQLCSPEIAAYHSNILEKILRMSDRCHQPTVGGNQSRDPSDRAWLATQAFEFCVREASSADVGSNLAYVGTFGLFSEMLLGYVPETDREAVMKWNLVHSDEEIGSSLGWGGTAELGHARDARLLVSKVFEGINHDNFVEALNTASEMSELRRDFWRLVTNQLEKFDHSPNAIKIPSRKAAVKPTLVHHLPIAVSKVHYERNSDTLVISLRDGQKLEVPNDLSRKENAVLFQLLGITGDVLKSIVGGQMTGVSISTRVNFEA